MMRNISSNCDNRPTEYIADNAKTLVSENDSPDVGFRYSINPYRGCAPWLLLLLRQAVP